MELAFGFIRLRGICTVPGRSWQRCTRRVQFCMPGPGVAAWSPLLARVVLLLQAGVCTGGWCATRQLSPALKALLYYVNSCHRCRQSICGNGWFLLRQVATCPHLLLLGDQIETINDNIRARHTIT
jgi:hypothetical protein